MSDPEIPSVVQPVVVSRRSRRASDTFSNTSAPATLRPITILATIAFGALVALSAYADPYLLAAAVGVVGATLALGWHALLGGPNRGVPTIVLLALAAGSVILPAIAVGDPFLARSPLLVAAALILVFLHQLVRKPPRDRLVESLAISASGIALLAMGSSLVPLTRTLDGREVIAIAMAAVAASSLADLFVGRGSLHAWQLPIAMLLGGWAGMGVAWAAGAPRLGQAALLGFLAAAVSHAVRRVLAPQRQLASFLGQATSAAASLLAVGAVAYAFARTLIG